MRSDEAVMKCPLQCCFLLPFRVMESDFHCFYDTLVRKLYGLCMKYSWHSLLSVTLSALFCLLPEGEQNAVG